MVYLDTPQALVAWDPVTRCVLVEWRDFAFGEEYRAVLNAILKALVDHKANKLLADSRKMKATPQEDQDWLMKDWVPRSAKAGLKHSAVVLPKSTLGQMTLQRLMQASTGSKRLVSSDGTSYFETIEDAKKWLKSLP
ncbi:MAG TPA: STAS/SEC14 domain-containing protein [Polyangiaceae bacterium]|nr:STAS/SEC14 domain-containing protein [Polyangiaceae bacterium]